MPGRDANQTPSDGRDESGQKRLVGTQQQLKRDIDAIAGGPDALTPELKKLQTGSIPALPQSQQGVDLKSRTAGESEEVTVTKKPRGRPKGCTL